LIRHMLLFRFRPEVDLVECQAMVEELSHFPDHFPTMRNFAIGRNASKRDDRFTHAMTVEFVSWSDLDDYLSSERHERFVADMFRPLIEERAIASFDDNGSGVSDQRSR
jgi:2,3-dihydroxy-p-cumate/2,3-dihydroxybenzoate 3,4-dioxygenase